MLIIAYIQSAPDAPAMPSAESPGRRCALRGLFHCTPYLAPCRTRTVPYAPRCLCAADARWSAVVCATTIRAVCIWQCKANSLKTFVTKKLVKHSAVERTSDRQHIEPAQRDAYRSPVKRLSCSGREVALPGVAIRERPASSAVDITLSACWNFLSGR